MGARTGGQRGQRADADLAVGESSVTLLHRPLPVVGVSTVMERGRQQNDRTLANGQAAISSRTKLAVFDET